MHTPIKSAFVSKQDVCPLDSMYQQPVAIIICPCCSIAVVHMRAATVCYSEARHCASTAQTYLTLPHERMVTLPAGSTMSMTLQPCCTNISTAMVYHNTDCISYGMLHHLLAVNLCATPTTLPPHSPTSCGPSAPRQWLTAHATLSPPLMHLALSPMVWPPAQMWWRCHTLASLVV